MVLKFPDYNLEIEAKVMMDVLHLDTPACRQTEIKNYTRVILADYLNIKTRRKQFEAVKK